MISLDPFIVILSVGALAGLFAALGVLFTRGVINGPDDFVAARNSMNGRATASTVLASALGAWILFGPAEMATWGGAAAVAGYAFATAAPRFAIIPLGLRMRQLMPRQVAMTEFVRSRFGRGMHGFTLIVMLFYLVISVAAEVTGMALIVALIADVPLWVTAFIVLVATLLYTGLGGLRASILTDRLQIILILPFLAGLVLIAAWALDGFGPAFGQLGSERPELLSFNHGPGLEAVVALIIGLAASGLFNQGNWQRIYAARDRGAFIRGFSTAGVLVLPVILLLGMFGLIAVAQDNVDQPSLALFAVLFDATPAWVALAMVFLGLALVMSSADSALNGIASLLTADMPRAFPRMSGARLLRLGRLSGLVVALPAFAVASQGYSILYLFLLANLFCVAAAGPVVIGLYSRFLSGRAAIVATAVGLLAGLVVFPDPAMTRGNLMVSYCLALILPIIVAVGARLLRPSPGGFDFAILNRQP